MGLRFRRFPPLDRRLAVCVGLIVVFAVAMFSRPHTYMHGGWDPGEYINTALHIDRIGSIRFQDPWLPEFRGEVRRILSRNPEHPRPTLHAGYLVLNAETGEMVPDYYHLYPAWLSVWISPSSPTSVYWGQTLISVIAILLLFLLVRRLLGDHVAFLTGATMLVNPAVHYFARFPSSEMLSMSLLLGCLFLLDQREGRPTKRSWVWLAVTTYAAITGHIINMIPLVSILAVLLLDYGLRRSPGALKDSLALFLGVSFGVIRNAWATPLFVSFLFQSYVIDRPGYIVGSLVIVFLVAMIGLFIWRRIKKISLQRGRLTEWHGRLIPGLLMMAFGFYQYVIRPRVGYGHNAINLRSLGWLFSPVGLLLVFASPFWFVRQRLRRTVLCFLAVGTVMTVIILQHKNIQPFYMWAFRRYIPVIIPFFSVCMAYCLHQLCRAIRENRVRQLLYGGFVLMLGWQFVQGRHLLRIQEHRGLPAYVFQLAHQLPEADFILIDHWKMATPLRIGMGLPVYQLSHETDPVDEFRQSALYEFLIEKLRNDEEFLYLSHTRPFYLPGYHPQALASFEQRAEILRWQRYGIPTTRQEDHSDIHVFRFVPGPEENLETFEMDIGYHSVGLLRGFHAMWQRDGETGRWTDGDAALYIPGVLAGGSLTLTLAHGRPIESTERLEVRLGLDGEPLDTLHIEQGWTEYSVTLPPSKQATRKLTIESDTWDPAQFGIAGYPTNLGVSMTHLRIKHTEEAER